MPKFLSGDPGINMMGFAVIDPTDGFQVIETILIKNARKFTDEEKAVEAVYGTRAVKVKAILARINELVDTHGIDQIVLEAPFYNALTPAAFGSLLEIIVSIKYGPVMERNLLFKTIEPMIIKKLFSNSHMASKEVMRQFLRLKISDGSIKFDGDIELLSEHEVDAIAIGYVFYMSAKDQPAAA